MQQQSYVSKILRIVSNTTYNAYKNLLCFLLTAKYFCLFSNDILFHFVDGKFQLNVLSKIVLVKCLEKLLIFRQCKAARDDVFFVNLCSLISP